MYTDSFGDQQIIPPSDSFDEKQIIPTQRKTISKKITLIKKRAGTKCVCLQVLHMCTQFQQPRSSNKKFSINGTVSLNCHIHVAFIINV